MYAVPITSPSHVTHFSNTVCVTVCPWCFFGVANVCLNDYMREFAKVASFLNHRVRADLPETCWHWGLDDLTLNCATMEKRCYVF